MKRIFYSLILLVFAVGAQAAPVVLDFEGPDVDYGAPESPGSSFFDGPVITKGFQIDYRCPQQSCAGNFIETVNPSPTPALAWGPRGTIELTSLDASSFDLLSMDVTAVEGGAYSIVGIYATGGTVQVDLVSPAPFTLNSVSFDASWVGLSAVQITAPVSPGIVDNISLNVVPIPAAVWLFGSALFGLGWVTRVS